MTLLIGEFHINIQISGFSEKTRVSGSGALLHGNNCPQLRSGSPPTRLEWLCAVWLAGPSRPLLAFWIAPVPASQPYWLNTGKRVVLQMAHVRVPLFQLTIARLWTSALSLLGLCFLICKMGV